MNQHDKNRVQDMFLEALQQSDETRDAWLVDQCGDDAELLADVRSLLDHDNPDDDLLEQPIDVAIGGIGSTVAPGADLNTDDFSTNESIVDHKLFLSKLSEVGVLSAEELHSLGQSLASSENTSNPRKLASELVDQGKLTEYQASALLKGQPDLLIDKYLILDLLDAGGMGMVFKAIHRPMNRMVAVKMIAQHLLASPDQVKRFQREVRVAATLEHPNVVRAYDADQARGVYFLVMEYVRGENLTRIVHRDGPMSVERAVDCIRQAAKGMRYAHKRGVIHRDIKPGNLMLTDEGLVKVLDLGLANVDESFRLAQQSSLAADDGDGPRHSETDLTTAGTVLGTVSFMAPEQSLDAKQADARSDIYSLGCTLYYLLTGESPYHGDTVFQVFLLHRDGPVPTIRDKRPDVPSSVDAVCQKMLAKKADDRHQSMSELLAAIDDCEISAPPSQRVGQQRKSAGKSSDSLSATKPTVALSPKSAKEGISWAGLAIVTILALLLLGGGYAWRQMNRTSETLKSSVANAEQSDTSIVSIPAAASNLSYGLSFDGRDDYVEVPSLKDFGTKPFTIEAFVTPQGEQKQTILSAAAVQFEIDFSQSGNAFYRPVLEAKTGAGHWAGVGKFSQVVLASGRRQHLAFVFDGVKALGYINGILVMDDLKYYGADGTSNDGREAVFPVSKHPIEPTLIGRHIKGQAGWGKRFFNGTIDELRLSTVPRYKADFAPVDHFESDDNTLALYHFDEGQGDVLTDSSGNGHHGNVIGAQWVKVYDEANMSAADLLATGEYEWRVVERLPEPINSSSHDNSADMSADGLTIVFSSHRSGGHGFGDLWIATRDSVEENWHAPVNLGSSISSPEGERHPVFSSDGQSIFFERWSNEHGSRLFVSHKDPRNTQWAPAKPFEFIVRPKRASSPDLSRDGKTFIDCQSNGVLCIAMRDSISDRWPQAVRIGSPVESSEGELAGTISDDRRMLVFQRGSRLLVTTRGSQDEPWSEPIRMDSLNEAGSATHPRLLADGKSLLFASDRPGGVGNYNNIYLARLVRKVPATKTESQSNPDALADRSEDSVASLNRALRFDSGAIELPEFDWRGGKEVSWEARVAIDNNSESPIFEQSNREYSWRLKYGRRDRWSAYVARNSDDATPAYTTSESPAVPSGSYHLAMVWDGSSLRLFVDGKLVATDAWTQPPSGSSIKIAGSGDPWELFGTIDEIRFSNVARYTEDYTPVDRFEPDEHTVALYHCDDDGDTLVDSSGNGYDVDLTKAVNGRVQKVIAYDEENLSAADLLATGEYEWRVDGRLPEPINSERGDLVGGMTADGLTIVFSSARRGGFGKNDLYLSTRPSTDQSWSEPANLGEMINTAREETLPTITQDGLSLIYLKRLEDGANKPFLSTRSSTNSPWPEPVPMQIGGDLEFQFIQWIDLTPDGRTVAFSKGSQATGIDLWINRRPLLDSTWQQPTRLPASINTDANEFVGTISNDGRLLIFNRHSRDGSTQEVWQTTRAGWDDEWTEPVIIEAFHASQEHCQLRLLPDGRSLLFSSNRAGGVGGCDIYLARLLRKPPLPKVIRSVSEGPPVETSEANLSAADLLATGEYEWRVAERLPEPINSSERELSADISEDGLTLALARGPSHDETELWIASRDSVDDPWPLPQKLGPEFNSIKPAADSILTDNGLQMAFSRGTDGLGGERLYFATRSERNSWSSPIPIKVRWDIHQTSPDITPNGLTLLFRQNNASGHELKISRRASPSDDWPVPQWLGPPVNTEHNETGGTISNDGRVLIFCRESSGRGPLGIERRNLWLTTRTGWDQPWSEPVLLDKLNSASLDQKPRLLPDGKTLLFSSNRPGGAGRFDIYRGRLMRKDTDTDVRSINLLKNFSVEQAVGRTDNNHYFWSKTDTGIAVTPTDADDPKSYRPLIEFPSPIEGSYSFQMKFTPRHGQYVLGLPITDHVVNLPLRSTDGTGLPYKSGLQDVDDTGKFYVGPTIKFDAINNLAVSVIQEDESVSVDAELNGVQIANFRGRPDELSSHRWMNLSPNRISLECYASKGASIHAAELTPLANKDQ